MAAFHLTKTFENVDSAANGTEISPKSIQKFLKLLNFEMRTIQPQNQEIREAKLNGRTTSRKKFSKIWVYLARLSSFSEILESAVPFATGKLPKIQTRRLVEWKAPNIYPFLMPHRTTVSTGRTLRHRLTMKVFQWNTWSLIWLTCTEANNYSNLVTRPKKCSANTLVLPHGSGAISEACVTLCA